MLKILDNKLQTRQKILVMTLYQQPQLPVELLAQHLDRWLCSCDTIEQLYTCETLAEKWLDEPFLTEFIQKAQVQRILINLLNEEL